MYEAEVKDAIDALAGQDTGFFASTVSQAALLASAQRTLDNLDRDIARLGRDGAVLFAPAPAGAAAGEQAGHDLAALFDGWRADPPSTTALICAAAEHFGIPASNENLKAALLVSLAAGVENTNPYHSTSHFREVTASIARLAQVNNDLALKGEPGAETLDAGNLAKCLLAAAAHDLLHDGRGNSPAGPRSWQQYRLENMAIGAAEPFMQLAGMTGKDIEDVRTMIRVTDISHHGTKTYSPHKYLRQIHAETFEGLRAAEPRPLAAPAGLDGLETDKTLLVMAALLSDADLSPSAATDYAFGRKMTTLFSREMPATIKDTDQTLAGFISFVTEQKFTSAAGNAASGDALTGIYREAAARAAKENEQKPGPRPGPEAPPPPKPAL